VTPNLPRAVRGAQLRACSGPQHTPTPAGFWAVCAVSASAASGGRAARARLTSIGPWQGCSAARGARLDQARQARVAAAPHARPRRQARRRLGCAGRCVAAGRALGGASAGRCRSACMRRDAVSAPAERDAPCAAELGAVHEAGHSTSAAWMCHPASMHRAMHRAKRPEPGVQVRDVQNHISAKLVSLAVAQTLRPACLGRTLGAGGGRARRQLRRQRRLGRRARRRQARVGFGGHAEVRALRTAWSVTSTIG